MATLPSLAEFTQMTKAMGYEGVSIRDWAPNSVSDTHTHEFAVHAVIAKGEMWMTRGEDTQHLQVGDTFTMEPDTPHAEKYGAEGTIYWAARLFPKI